MADGKKLNNLALRVLSKTLIHSMLARNAKDKLHEKMGNLTFIYPRKLLIISDIAKSSTCRLFKKRKAGSTIRQAPPTFRGRGLATSAVADRLSASSSLPFPSFEALMECMMLFMAFFVTIWVSVL